MDESRLDNLDLNDDELEELSWMNYEGLLDMEVEFIADLGQTSLSIKGLLGLQKGSVIDLNKPAGESVEAYVNNRIIGKGEVMVYEKIQKSSQNLSHHKVLCNSINNTSSSSSITIWINRICHR